MSNGAVGSEDPCYVAECGSKSVSPRCLSFYRQSLTAIKCYPDQMVDTVYYNPLSGNCDITLGRPAPVCCPNTKGQTCTSKSSILLQS